MQVINEGGTEEQKKKFFTMFAEDDDCTGSVLLSEPNAGSDTLLDPEDIKAGVSMKADEDGDCYVLNGTKHMSSLIGFSKVLIVYGRTDRTVRSKDGTTTFIVPPEEMSGITYGQVHDKMGYRLYPNGESFWDNVRVPKAYILDEVNDDILSRTSPASNQRCCYSESAASQLSIRNSHDFPPRSMVRWLRLTEGDLTSRRRCRHRRSRRSPTWYWNLTSADVACESTRCCLPGA